MSSFHFDSQHSIVKISLQSFLVELLSSKDLQQICIIPPLVAKYYLNQTFLSLEIFLLIDDHVYQGLKRSYLSHWSHSCDQKKQTEEIDDGEILCRQPPWHWIGRPPRVRSSYTITSHITTAQHTLTDLKLWPCNGTNTTHGQRWHPHHITGLACNIYQFPYHVELLPMLPHHAYQVDCASEFPQW